LKRSHEFLQPSHQENLALINLNAKRRRKAPFEDVNLALRDWIVEENQNTEMTPQNIRTKAYELFVSMYPDQPPRRFSNGWFECFILRYDLKRFVRSKKANPTNRKTKENRSDYVSDDEVSRGSDEDLSQGDREEQELEDGALPTASAATSDPHAIDATDVDSAYASSSSHEAKPKNCLMKCEEVFAHINALSTHWIAVQEEFNRRHVALRLLSSNANSTVTANDEEIEYYDSLIAFNYASLVKMKENAFELRARFESLPLDH
jgi:hypothetical protein